jgi:acetolactate synthase-1/3 small subunit
VSATPSTVDVPVAEAPGHHLLSVLVENKAGVLARVSGLFARRGFNIGFLAVTSTEDPRFSRITLAVDVESAPLDQVTKQLDKLVNVLEIHELDPAQFDSLDQGLRAFTSPQPATDK